MCPPKMDRNPLDNKDVKIFYDYQCPPENNTKTMYEMFSCPAGRYCLKKTGAKNLSEI